MIEDMYIYGGIGFLFIVLFITILFTKKENFKKIKKLDLLSICVIGGIAYTLLFVSSSNNAYYVEENRNIETSKKITNKTLSLPNTQDSKEKPNPKTKVAKSKENRNTNQSKDGLKSDFKKKLYIDKNGKGLIIGDTDSRIYHIPNSTYYKREMKKTSNNLYFKTIEEAELAGYRAPKR